MPYFEMSARQIQSLSRTVRRAPASEAVCNGLNLPKDYFWISYRTFGYFLTMSDIHVFSRVANMTMVAAIYLRVNVMFEKLIVEVLHDGGPLVEEEWVKFLFKLAPCGLRGCKN